MQFNIDHQKRYVDVRGLGDVFLQDILDYFDALVVENAMPYRKMIDMRGVTPRIDDNDMMTLGARVSAYANMEPRGPIAVVSTAPESDLFIRRFMNLGGAKRPMRLFNSLDAAKNWLDGMPEAEP
jgi:hypothetical protein